MVDAQFASPGAVRASSFLVDEQGFYICGREAATIGLLTCPTSVEARSSALAQFLRILLGPFFATLAGLLWVLSTPRLVVDGRRFFVVLSPLLLPFTIAICIGSLPFESALAIVGYIIGVLLVALVASLIAYRHADHAGVVDHSTFRNVSVFARCSAKVAAQALGLCCLARDHLHASIIPTFTRNYTVGVS